MDIGQYSKKIYSANLFNRLDELCVNPLEEDKIRWFPEMIQNATDTLFSETNYDKRDKIEITLEIKRDPENNQYSEVIFTHNGPPFNENQFYALACKCSSGKENNKSTGKFGTGFLTTHVLSRTVYISGDIIKNEHKKGFYFTMCREGKTREELEENLCVTQDSYHGDLEPFNCTQFKYPIRSELGRECVELGLIHFKKNVANILINCPNIEYIHLIDDTYDVKYSSILHKQINESIFSYKISCNEDVQYFLVAKDNEQNLDISIELDAQKYENDKEMQIVPHENDKESLFIIFPLIGSKAHILPFYVNSPDFYPTSERNGLCLNGPDYTKEEQTRMGRNKELLMRSIVLYGKLIEYLEENKCSNIYELSVGLKLLDIPYKTFDSKWYNGTFLKEMRKVLLNTITVNTISGKIIKLKDAFLPINQIDDEHVGQFINLSLAKKYYPNIVSNDDCIKWRNRIWEIINQMQLVSIHNIIENIQKDPSILLENQLTSLNEFISFIYNYNKELFYTIPFVPDMNNVFRCIIKDGKYMKKCQAVPDELIELMESINIQWKSTHINKMITSTYIPEDLISDAENLIKEKVKNDDHSCFYLMQYVLENNETRKNMFDLVNRLSIDHIHWEHPIVIKNVSPNIWESADSKAIDKIMHIFWKYDQNTIREKIDLMSKFVSVFKNHYKSNERIINTTKIIPNGNFEMKCLNDLYNKSDIFHDHLNPIMKQYFGIDFNDSIIHPQINKVIKSDKNEEITDFLELINQKINKLEREKQIQIAESVISIVPQNDGQTASLIDQNKLFEFYKHLNKPNLKQIIIDEKNFNSKNWKFSNQIILSTICQTIEKTEFLNKFEQKFSFDDDVAVELLNSVYNFESQYDINDHKIIPNKNGQFKNKPELISNPGINDDFYEILSILDPKSNIEQNIVHPKIKIQNLKQFDLVEFHQRLCNLFIDMTENAKSSTPNPVLLKLISNNAKIDLSGVCMSKEDQFTYDMLKNASLYCIKKRIRDYLSPSKDDYQRWAFELIQNSVDCIPNNEDAHYSDKTGIIKFKFKEDKVIFTHYGVPFTIKNYKSLVFQCGGLKEDDPSKIGRFGTGFLSTLVLSRIVYIEGDLIYDDGHISGFEIKINRNGKTTEELNKNVIEMEKTKKLNLPIKGKTKFTFILPNEPELKDKSDKAYIEGFNSLKENIPPVLIFNPSIKTIIISNKNESYSFYKTKSKNPIERVMQHNNITHQGDLKNFIHYKMKDTFVYQPNKSTKEITVSCLLECDEEGDIIPNKRGLFIGFPLFGPKKFDSSVILNSFDFEPEKERSDIIIQFDDKIQDSHDSSKNKFIVSKGMELFEKIILYTIDNNYGNLFNAFIGIYKYYNLAKNNVISVDLINSLNRIILTYNIFETSLGHKKNSQEIILPKIVKYEEFEGYNFFSKDHEILEENLYNEFYNLLAEIQINQKHLVMLEHCSKWLSLLPFTFPSFFTIEQFFQMISKLKTISDLKFTRKDSKEKFIKNLVIFVAKMRKCNDILNDNKILINFQGQFVFKGDIRKFELPTIFLDMLDIVQFNYSKYILHPEIEHLYTNKKVKFFKYGIKDAIKDIKDHINSRNSIPLMKYVIDNNKKRESMFWFTSFFRKELTDIIYIRIPENDDKCLANLRELFAKADENVLEILIKEYQNINPKDNIDFIHNFLQFLKENIPNDRFIKEQLIPNQEYKLYISKDLHKDQIQNEDIKNVLQDILGINIRESLVHDSCSDIINCEVSNLQNISQIVLNIINKDVEKYKEKDLIGFYEIIFQHSLTNIKDLPIIIELISFFLNKEIELKIQEDETKCWLPSLTEKVMKIAINDIVQYISKFSNVIEIKDTKEEIELLYRKLPILYSYALKYECLDKIFPNYFGDLKTIDEIQFVYDSQIEIEILDELVQYLIILHEPGEIEMTFLNKSIILDDELKRKIKPNFYDLNKLANDIVKSIDQWKEKNKKSKCDLNTNSFSYNKFVSFISQNDKLKIAFVDKLPNLFRDNKFEMVKNMDNFTRYLQVQQLINILSILSCNIQMPHNILEVPFLMEAYFYELFSKSGKFCEILWPNLSKKPTDIFVKYQNNKYFIDKKEQNYHFKAVDYQKNNYYFVIISPNSYSILRNEQKNDILSLTESNDHFVEIIIDDKIKPPFLWLTKPNIII